MEIELNTEKGDDLETIRERLAEAVAWFEIAARLPDSGFPRSTDLHPRHLDTDRRHVVWWVARDRRTALKGDRGTTGGRIEGRLLGYAPDETVHDGASESVTAGFFNIEDEPPWDLWLAWVVEKNDRPRENLVCWIPPSLVKTADDGIEVNPVACIDWLPQLEQELGLS